MLLDDLVTAIQTVQARIREHGDSLRKDEYRTRLSLVDPVLHALGWDVSDPVLVTPEYQAGSGRADYALLDEDSNPKAFIEAKRLGEHLESHFEQIYSYGWDARVKNVGLTDGNRWIFEDLVLRFNRGESRILDITISDETPEVCAKKFLYRAHNVLLFEQVTPTLLGKDWISLTNSKTLGGVRRISQMYIPDKGEIQLSGPSQFMIETAEWLIREGKLGSWLCPVSEDGNRFIVHADPPVYGSHPPHRLSNGLYLYKAHWHLNTLLSNTKFLVGICGLDPASILLKPAE